MAKTEKQKTKDGKHKIKKTEELKKDEAAGKTRKKKAPKKKEIKISRDQEIGGEMKAEEPKENKAAKELAELLEREEYQAKPLRRGQLVEGTVIHKTKRELLLDLGAKSEGIITGEELEDPDNTFRKAEVGDKIFASVVQSENDQGYIVLSLRRAAPERKWKEMYEAHETGGKVKVEVLEYHKGGLLVDAGGLRGFVPLSHLDRAHLPLVDRSAAGGSQAELLKQLKPLIGKTLTTQILEIDRSQNRLVLSEKDALAEKIEARREKALEAASPGDVFDGVVSGIMPFGLFVRLRDPDGEDVGLEGLVHVSELSWERKFSVGRDYKVGDEVRVKILEADPSQDKLALSIKALTEDPWSKAAEKYPIGSKVKGKVTKIMPYGAFVNLEPGLDGLLHVSETAGPLTIGEEVEAIVINLTPGERRMGLSVRKLSSSTRQPEPRAESRGEGSPATKENPKGSGDQEIEKNAKVAQKEKPKKPDKKAVEKKKKSGKSKS